MPQNLPEESGPIELREVNSSFNRMVQDITRVENDRECCLPVCRTTCVRPSHVCVSKPKWLICRGYPQQYDQRSRADGTIVNQFMAYARRSTQPMEKSICPRQSDRAISTARLEIDPAVSSNRHRRRHTYSRQPDRILSCRTKPLHQRPSLRQE